jgi:hypothetical protein
MREGFDCELSRTVWVGVITLPLIPSHQGRGSESVDSLTVHDSFRLAYRTILLNNL